MFTIEWFANFGFSVLRLSTPLIFAGLAAVISKKAGMMNMALEGMMLAAALGGVIFAGMTGNVWAGLAGAILLSVLVSLIIAFANLTGQTDLYLTCIAAVCLFELLVLKLTKGPRSGQLIRILPVAAVNSGVLGTVLVERTQSFTLEQSLGFGLGSGLGYLLAVMLVTEAQNRLRSRAIPEAFRGLPVTLIYIGVLALAIYGFTGHSVIL